MNAAAAPPTMRDLRETAGRFTARSIGEKEAGPDAPGDAPGAGGGGALSAVSPLIACFNRANFDMNCVLDMYDTIYVRLYGARCQYPLFGESTHMTEDMTAKAPTWNEDTPIYRQLVDLMIARILDQTYREGEMMPSVRQLATEYGVNPLTASKAYQELAKFDLTEKRRGIGLVIKEGVRDVLLKHQQKQFLREEWPQILERIERLELDPQELLKAAKR